MSLHETIVTEIHRLLDEEPLDIVSPTSLARAVHKKFAPEGLDLHIAYTSTEHLKQLARRVLASRFGPESEESAAYEGELFSGALQSRYPLPHQSGEDPVYKLKELMTSAELRWNGAKLLRASDALAKHGRAVLAYADDREESSASQSPAA